MVNGEALDTYLTFIDQCEEQPKNLYGEKHHILPRAMFPSYSNPRENPWNIKRLKAEDHYVAHYLLYRLYPEKMTYPWHMAHKDGGNLRRNYTPEFLAKYADEYAASRKNRKLSAEHRRRISESGKGVPKSPETRARMSESMKLRVLSPESREKGMAKLRGRHHSEETKQKMRDSSPHLTPFQGRKHTEETKRKIAIASQRPRKNKGGVV